MFTNYASMKRARTLYWTAALFIFGLLISSIVWGHTQFVGSDPEADAILQESPREVVLRFSQAVTLVAVSIIGPEGSIVASESEAQEYGPRVVLPVTSPLDAGQYSVSFRVLSGDSHPIAGSFRFGIAATSANRLDGALGATSDRPTSPTDTPATVVTQNANTWAVLEQIVRAVFIVILLLTSGLALFRLLIALPDNLEAWVVQLTRNVSYVGMLLVAAYIVLATVGATGIEAFRPRHLHIILESSLGRSLIVAFIGLLMLSLSGAKNRSLGGLGALVVVCSRVLTGHPASQEPSWVLIPGMVIHFATAAFWFAAIWVILRILRNGPFDAVPGVLGGFVRAAGWSLFALFMAGLVMAAVHLGSVTALLHTDYGRLLLCKLLVVGGLLILVVVNKWFLTPDYLRHQDSTRLKTSILIEALFMIAVIALSTLLAATPPASRAELSTQGALVPLADFDQERFAFYREVRLE